MESKKQTKEYLFIIIFFIISSTVFAQSNEIDSLERWVANYPKKDTALVLNLIELEAVYYNSQSNKFGTKISEIITTSTEIKFHRGIVRGYILKSKLASSKDNYSQALQYAHEALNSALKMPNYYFLQSIAYNEVALVLINNPTEKRLYEALKYSELALQTAKKSGRVDRVNNAYIWLTYNLLEAEQANKAYTLIKEAMIFAKQNNILNGQLYNLMGRTLIAKEKYTEALVYLNKGEEYLKNDNQPLLLNVIYHHKGLAYARLGNFTKSELYLKKSLELSQGSNLDTVLPTITELQKITKKTGNYKESLQYAEQIMILKDSLINTQKNRDFIELQTKYETEKKEQENLFLSEKNQTIEKQNRTYLIALVIFLLLLGIAVFLYFQLFKSKKQLDVLNVRLSETNQQKDKLFKIISHDLKTPATTFVQLTNTINHYINTKQFEKLNELGSNAQFLANDLQAIVNNLLYWSMSQQGILTKRLEKVYVEDIVEELKDAYTAHCQLHHIEFGIERPERIELMANRVHLSTVLRNIVSNAMKFTPDGEKILMVITSNPTHTEIALHDAGKGFSHEELQQFEESQKLESKTGLHGEKGTGLGLTIVNEIVKLYDGTLSIANSSELSGACIRLIFKHPKPLITV